MAAITLGVILQKRKAAEQEEAEEKKKTSKKEGKKSEGEAAKAATAAKAAAAPSSAGFVPGIPGQVKEAAPPPDPVAVKLWETILKRTDEYYVVAEHMQSTFEAVVKRLVYDTAKDADDATRNQMLEDIEFPPLMDPVRLHQRGVDDFSWRFSDGELSEACVPDVLRARVAMPAGPQVVQLVQRLTGGVGFAEDGLELKPAAEPLPGAEPPANVTEVKVMQLVNRFHDLDPTHFRQACCSLKLTHKAISIFCELEVHYTEILNIGDSADSDAYEHYNFFRKRLEGKVPAHELDALLEEKLVFLVDATGIPVLLSLLVLIFTSGGEDLSQFADSSFDYVTMNFALMFVPDRAKCLQLPLMLLISLLTYVTSNFIRHLMKGTRYVKKDNPFSI